MVVVDVVVVRLTLVVVVVVVVVVVAVVVDVVGTPALEPISAGAKAVVGMMLNPLAEPVAQDRSIPD